MSIERCRLINLQKISDPRGNLSFVEGNRHIPFDIKRVYYLYDIPGGETRGGHAHKNLQQLIIAMAGSFDVVLDDGYKKVTYSLNRSYIGLYLDRMIWRELVNFSTNAVCLVLASNYYEEEDYYRNYNDFLMSARDYYGSYNDSLTLTRKEES
ncbi:sugar 3,4-ketoisomerase [Aneurinibacillus tyrosinisolvens]|uniref:sugar 3,4-ketoisomerase n=1 Tax=Aneurinibacillus tyrosinisolvens TaxID=1443435 RepID=UPI00063F5006|nr:FdtA/QdtA family cupin domain-containing protein [Aneurinibacillus tyrosinisolvens]